MGPSRPSAACNDAMLSPVALSALQHRFTNVQDPEPYRSWSPQA
jgi:hypothetical protein